MLETIFPPEIVSFLRQPPAANKNYRTPTELETVLDVWGQQGADIIALGHSKEGRSLRAAVIGDGPQTLLAWGYPHPDEPVGAEALCWLGEAALAGQLPELLRTWRLVLILCADVDEASRQLWFTDHENALAYSAGCWRPSHLDWMVDYGFPLQWGPFWQPPDYEGSCRTERECTHAGACGGQPHGPLPESLALATAIDRFRPQVVASMHNTHSGGDYTFLLEREKRPVLESLVALPGAFGLSRHLGEPIDRGRRWLRHAPDLIHEPTLTDFQRQLESMRGYNPEHLYQRNHSAAAYLQARGWSSQFICPETTLFRDPAFGDNSILEETVEALAGVEERRRGRYETVRIRIDEEWVIAHQQRTDAGLRTPIQTQLPLTRGMLGVSALHRRRHVLAAADDIWKDIRALPGTRYHPYADERKLLQVPGAFVHDRSQLIFRTRPDYARAPTRAQAASFRWLWPLHTATLLGNFQNYLHTQPPTPQIKAATSKISALQAQEVAMVPPSMRAEGPLAPALASALARVLLLMQVRTPH